MKSRTVKIENAGILAMVKPGKRGLSNTPSCGKWMAGEIETRSKSVHR